MKNSFYRIFFTDCPPFSPDGKGIASIWKKADIYSDLFGMAECGPYPVKSRIALLYDRENLYIHGENITPGKFHLPQGSLLWSTPHMQFYFPLKNDKKKILQISINEFGEKDSRYLFGEKFDIPEMKYFSRLEKRGKEYLWEASLILPLSSLGNAPENDGSFHFTALHFLQDPGLSCIQDYGVLSFMEGVFSRKTRFLNGFFTEKISPPRSYSAREEIEKEYSFSGIILDPADCKKNVYKNILGINNSPRIRSASSVEKEKKLFKKLSPARVRHHDAALTDPGFALIDVSRIFPLFHADCNDPANYDFAPTDLYLKHVKDCGVPIEFRFGESIEHSGTTFRVKPPADPEKFADICLHILQHYNEGWANGMFLNIRYASLWEEPDGIHNLFTGPYEKYLALYKAFSGKMKERFPQVKIGGPQAISMTKIEEFLKYCRDNNLKLDFCGTTAYSRDPFAFAVKGRQMKEALRKYGYPEAEIFLSEWHLCPPSFTTVHQEKPGTLLNAAFSLAALTDMQTTFDMAYYYIWASVGYYGLFSNPEKPYKVFYALSLYTEFISKKGKILPVKMEKELPGTFHLASMDPEGKIFLLIARYRSITDTLTLTLPEAYHFCRIKQVSSSTSKTGYKTNSVQGRKGVFTLSFAGEKNGVYLLELDKK